VSEKHGTYLNKAYINQKLAPVFGATYGLCHWLQLALWVTLQHNTFSNHGIT